MATITLPTLSEDSWVTEPAKILDYLFSYYILTDSQQSLLFKDVLVSLPATYYLNINNPDGFSDGVKSDFGKILDLYFAVNEVGCYTKKDPTNESLYYLYLSAVVTDDAGTRYELNKITQLKDGRSNKVITYNNQGDAYSDFAAL